METCVTFRARPNPPSVTSVLHISQTPLSLISVWLWWNKVPGPGWDTVMPLFSILKDVWGKLMIWMSLSPPGQVYSSQIQEKWINFCFVLFCFANSSVMSHITPLEAISLLFQGSERYFIQCLPLVSAAFNLYTNSWVGTHSFPSLLRGEASLSHYCSGASSTLRSDLCVGKGNGEVLSFSWWKVPLIWGPFCVNKSKIFSSSQGFLCKAFKI